MSRTRAIGILAAIVLSLVAAPLVAQTVQNVQLHGYAQNRFYANPDSTARFVTERVSLSAVGQIGDDGTGYLEVYFHPWLPSAIAAEQYRTYVESAYVDLPLGPGRIRVGKGRQLNFGMTPSYGNRKTTQYGIVAETFTQDRITGAQYAMKQGSFDWGATLYTDLSIGTRGIGEYPGVPAGNVVRHLAERDVPADASGRLAMSTRLGFTTPCFQAHLSGAVGGLNPNQLGTINTAYAAPANTNTDHSKFGLDTAYSSGPFVVQGEWYTGKFSFVRVTGYNILAGIQQQGKNRAYVRWAALNNDQAPTANTATWNTQQLTFAFVQPIRKGVWAEFQYEKNMESPPAGVAKVKNDLLFVELFTGF